MSREPSDAGRAWLESALGELAEADAAEQAAPHVEQALRTAFREAAASAAGGAARHGRPRRSSWAWWVAAAAAGLAMASAVAVRAPRDKPAARADVTADESAFVPLVEGEPLAGLDAVQLVRVRLPRTALERFGGPPDGSVLGSVDAEVLLGQDGVARAIRVVE